MELFLNGRCARVRPGRRAARAGAMPITTPLKATIVIPVYNEEGILESSVVDLVGHLEPLGISYEVLLAENGSRDDTVVICERLGHRFPRVKHFSVGTPGNGNYGLALRQGILAARGEYVFCDEIDLCDTGFYGRALELLEGGQADL